MWAWIELQRFLFCVKTVDIPYRNQMKNVNEVRKGDYKYVLCFGLDVSGAPVLADHNSVDFCSGSLCYV